MGIAITARNSARCGGLFPHRGREAVRIASRHGARSWHRICLVERRSDCGRWLRGVPIVDDGRLVGIVTSSDLLELIGRGIDRPAAADRHGLHHRVPHRKAKTATGVW
jgi:CBS domain-containing protein